MPVLQLNTSISEDEYAKAGSGFDPIPAGKYEAFVYEIETATVKNDGPNKGKPRLKFKFKIADGQESADGTNVGGRFLWFDVNYFESPNKEGKMQLPFDLLNLAKALGKTLEEVKNLDTDDWTGDENSLQVKVDVVPKRVQDPKTKKWVDSTDPDELTNRIGGFRSLASASTSSAAKGAVRKAPARASGIKLL